MANVKKINGYNVYDAGARNILNTHAFAIQTITGKVETIEDYYFDNRKIYELEVTLTGVADTVVNESINLPTGYNCSNTMCVYYYVSYNIGNNEHSPCRIFTNPNLAIYIAEVNIVGHEIAPYLTVAFKGTASTDYKITIGLLKVEEPEPEEEEQQGE